MDTWQVLVIILSITLTVFLLAGIILMGYLIKIARSVQRITDKAENVANSLSEASRYVRPAVVASTVADFLKKATSKTRKKRSSKEEE